MYLRIATVRKPKRTYRYAQLVESYRRADGKPTNRVICSLGQLDDDAIAAVRAALAAARGKPPVLPAAAAGPRPRVHRSLRYLDVAVLLRVWRDAGLRDLLLRAFDGQSGDVSEVDVIEALVLQRCLAPASKLAASRWYGRTALPELQAVVPSQFNNSRVHRVMTRLEAVEDRLQAGLPSLVTSHTSPVSALVIDATDTWFVGEGPPMAKKGVDKQGLYRRRIGLVLLCDERGYPLRWHTLDGRFHDPTALANMAEQVAAFPWARKVPLVVDRALGNAGWVDKLDKLGLGYVTCVPAPELYGCGAPVPWDVVEQLQASDDPDQVAVRARKAGFVPLDDRRYVLELGVFDKLRPHNADRISQAVLAMQVLDELETSTLSRRELAAQLGFSLRSLQNHYALQKLTPALRQRIRAGEADALNRDTLCKIAVLPAAEQGAALDTAIAAAPARKRRANRKRVAAMLRFPARGALCLNPVRLIEDRRADEARLARVRTEVDELNRKLASPQSRRTDASALAAVVRKIRQVGLGNVCTVRMTKVEGRRAVALDCDPTAWQQRRRTDGLCLVVSHPSVRGSAAERVKLYFAKDVVEKDFQAIKSVLELRPVRHRTDPKLRAHVTICVLALLVLRLLEARLLAAGRPMTAVAALETLQPVQLNLIKAHRASYYTITQPDEPAADLVTALGLEALLDDVDMAALIAPR